MAYSWKSTQVPDERIVIIGNGFDLECDLRTSYGAFLAFVREAQYSNRSLCATTARPVDWQGLRERNFWFRRFEEVRIGNGWVDFENEIARVVTTVERSMLYSHGSKAFLDDVVQWQEMSRYGSISREIYKMLPEGSASKCTYRKLVRVMLDDLEALTRCLEAYLFEYACQKRPKETAVVSGLVKSLGDCGHTSVISFNYTQTLERLLRREGVVAKYCYVHGTIGDGTSKNTMVLGIDEHLDASEVEKFVDFGPFRKYNQRIYKQTDSRYMTWLQEARLPYDRLRQLNEEGDRLLLSSSQSNELNTLLAINAKKKDSFRKKTRHREVVVFGHSLGITDKDILHSFIMLPDTRTVVYYHDDESFSNQVSNMTAILGMDEVISRTGGRGRTLKFVDQRELAI